MKYDRAGVLSIMQQQSERIRSNEKKFEEDMQKAWDALDAENNRLSLGEQQQQRNNAMEQDNLDRQHQRDMEKMDKELQKMDRELQKMDKEQQTQSQNVQVL